MTNEVVDMHVMKLHEESVSFFFTMPVISFVCFSFSTTACQRRWIDAR